MIHTNATLFSNFIHDPQTSHPAKLFQANKHLFSTYCIMQSVQGSSVNLKMSTTGSSSKRIQI